MTDSSAAPERLTVLFARFAPRIYAYARRHSDAVTADDVVAETFLVALRRIDDIPAEALPWLLVVARNVLANLRRATARGQRVADELAGIERLAAPAPSVDRVVIDRADLLAALGALTALEREAVLLVAWDGLAPRDAAAVADCSPRTFNVRLHRARRRLARAMDFADAADAADAAADQPVLRLMEKLS